MATKIYYLSYEDAVLFHLQLMAIWNESRCGVDFKNLLISALSRPRNAAIYENADLIRQAATLCFGLIKNHPWRGGNKRTATHLTEIFLDINGVTIFYETPEILEMVLAVEADRWRVGEIENWLRSHVTKF